VYLVVDGNIIYYYDAENERKYYFNGDGMII
jgi:hypothetical protein